MVKNWLVVVFVFASSSGQQFHEPGAGVPQAVPGTAPKARGPSPKKHHHQDIHLDLEKEREHIKAQVKTDYIDTEKMDDNSLLMQYFRSPLTKLKLESYNFSVFFCAFFSRLFNFSAVISKAPGHMSPFAVMI